MEKCNTTRSRDYSHKQLDLHPDLVMQQRTSITTTDNASTTRTMKPAIGGLTMKMLKLSWCNRNQALRGDRAKLVARAKADAFGLKRQAREIR